MNRLQLKKIVNDNGQVKTFEEVGVSTKTVIAISNLNIDLDKFFTYIPITEYHPIEKKRGRKKRQLVEPVVKILPVGSIVLVQRRREHRGALLKNKSKRSNTFFLHSVTAVICLENNKFINIKVSSNGKFQITGCKTEKHYVDTIFYLFKNMKRIEEMTGERCYRLINSDNTLRIVFNTVMKNMDFNIGFNISRERLNKFINTQPKFVGIFEGSISTGVNIKVQSEQINDTELTEIHYDLVDDSIRILKVPYTNYYNLLEEKERKKESNVNKHHTFLIFASGSIIMSSRGPDMKRVFNRLIEILLKNKEQFEDKTVEEEKIIKEIVPLKNNKTEEDDDDECICNTGCCFKKDFDQYDTIEDEDENDENEEDNEFICNIVKV